jgi:chromosome segregation ATPase
MTLRRSHGAEQYSRLRHRLDTHLDDVEQVVESLRQELATCRGHMRSLTDERDRLRHQLVQADVVARDLAESAARLRETERDAKREVKLRQSLEQERRELVERCAALEESVSLERAQQANLALELECLEQQVAELKAIVGLMAGGSKVDQNGPDG